MALCVAGQRLAAELPSHLAEASAVTLTNGSKGRLMIATHLIQPSCARCRVPEQPYPAGVRGEAARHVRHRGGQRHAQMYDAARAVLVQHVDGVGVAQVVRDVRRPPSARQPTCGI